MNIYSLNWNYQPNTIFPQPVFGIECLDFCNIQEFSQKIDLKISNNTEKVNNENLSLAQKTTKSKLIQTSCPNDNGYENPKLIHTSCSNKPAQSCSKSIQTSCSNANAHGKKNVLKQQKVKNVESPKLSNCSSKTQGAWPKQINHKL